MTEKKDLTAKFRHVRLELARERNHPLGDSKEGYDILMPLEDDGRVDAAEWKPHQAACRVRRFRAGEDDRIGRLRRKPGGQWYFDYEQGEQDDEPGFRFGEERFLTGEYVSLTSQGTMHTYRVTSVEKP